MAALYKFSIYRDLAENVVSTKIDKPFEFIKYPLKLQNWAKRSPFLATPHRSFFRKDQSEKKQNAEKRCAYLDWNFEVVIQNGVPSRGVLEISVFTSQNYGEHSHRRDAQCPAAYQLTSRRVQN